MRNKTQQSNFLGVGHQDYFIPLPQDIEKEDDNPDYGTYYYTNGDRRQDVMEVSFE